MQHNPDSLVSGVLGRLEEEEEKLLSWGIVDGGFTREEVEDLAQEFLDHVGSDKDPESLIGSLRNRKLLFDLNLGSRRFYRTRMAESVRLFARLRQLFPGRNWQVAPTLVADFRFSLRSRRYPVRNIDPDRAVSELKNEKLLDDFKEKILRELLDSPGRGRVELASFQLASIKAMLRDLAGVYSRGMIVGASTGTGKTLAFYLPALTHIATLMSEKSFWTKALAIYPRNELLKDQFLETYRETRRIDHVLIREKGRKLVIGAFFGPTPRSASVEEIQKKWASQGDGYVCPYLPCPKCEGPLVWKESDIIKKIERLHCLTRDCRTTVEADAVVLTRDKMSTKPPDIVFTTTEMLNRLMGDSSYGTVCGIGAPRAPHLVLLDEVHTYSNVHGAQVAYLLRRWRKAVGGRVQFTGLSATLRNAGEFFAQLVGLNAASIQEISQGECLEVVGKEYQLALRGDPVSGASLLSTSIQSAMLFGRILDPMSDPKSNGAYGSRVFVFTDDLDVTNRFFHNLQDAEGLSSRGIPIPGRRPLAELREPGASDSAARLAGGQSWLICEKIGHPLHRSLRIGRTSSQDVGVEQLADIVVATASLEVGFNDPNVGGVMQHKAPLDMASFLQRKGRAGRRRAMRPWTVVILSDYGRDRIAYQGYDLLFDPLLNERTISVGNRYVLRMQAVFAMMDWFAEKLRIEQLPLGSIWNDFAGPVRGEAQWVQHIRQRQERQMELARGILERDDIRLDLEDYLRSALAVSDTELYALLWEPPRALMTAVVPTLLRRLESGWKRLTIRPSESTEDYRVLNSPLPDFVPSSLFSDLNLPEVIVETPPQNRGGEPLEAAMPIELALKEYAPGRVSRRFGIHHAFASHWIAPPDTSGGEQLLPVEEFCSEFDEEGIFQVQGADGEAFDVRCVRPRKLEPKQPPANIGTTSNSFLDWRSQFAPFDEGDRLESLETSAWKDLVSEIRAFTHTRRSHVEVRRFAVGARASIKFRAGNSVDTYIRFTNAGTHGIASIGFAKPVDGLAVRFNLPPGFKLQANDPNQQKIRSFRTAYFKHRIQIDPRLDGIANAFQREWLFQIYLSVLTARALVTQRSLESINKELFGSGRVGREMEEVLEVIFQTLEVEESDPELQNDVIEHGADNRQPTHERLSMLCRMPYVMDVLIDLARVLWEEPDDEWHSFAASRLKATLGGALLQACYQLCPQFENADLLLDIETGPRVSAHSLIESQEIWITESTLGGGGVIEEIVRKYNADPRHFFRLVEAALEPSDFEVVDSELTRILDLQATDTDVATAFRNVRESQGHEMLLRNTDELRRVLKTRSILVTHPVVAALNARILRPGSSKQTDDLFRKLSNSWTDEEARLGIEIDARVFAYVASANDDLDHALANLGHFLSSDRTWRFQAIYGLLWPRGNVIRGRALSTHNRFSAIPAADRELLLDLLRPSETRVSINDSKWRTDVSKGLKEGRTVELIAGTDQQLMLKLSLLDLVVEPLDINFLHFYPQLEGFRREPNHLVAVLGLREAVQ